MREPMNGDRIVTGIAKNDIGNAACRRIAGHRGCRIFDESKPESW